MNFTRRQFLWQVSAAPLQMRLLRQAWSAKWISAPRAPRTEYGVYHFRKTFDLAGAPRPSWSTSAATIATSCSSTAGGSSSGTGARRSVPLALRDRGRGAVSAGGAQRVRRGGLEFWRPGARGADHLQTGFLLQGDTMAERASIPARVGSASRDAAYSPSQLPPRRCTDITWRVPCDRVAAAQYPWGWEGAGFDDSPMAAGQL